MAWLVRRLGWASPGVAPIADLATFWGEVGVLYRRVAYVVIAVAILTGLPLFD